MADPFNTVLPTGLASTVWIVDPELRRILDLIHENLEGLGVEMYTLAQKEPAANPIVQPLSLAELADVLTPPIVDDGDGGGVVNITGDAPSHITVTETGGAYNVRWEYDAIPGYDSSKTQFLEHVSGTLTWKDTATC